MRSCAGHVFEDGARERYVEMDGEEVDKVKWMGSAKAAYR